MLGLSRGKIPLQYLGVQQINSSPHTSRQDRLFSHLLGWGTRRMKLQVALTAGLIFSALHLTGQAPAGAPAGANGMCKDGTYSTAAHRSGACSGHKGVQAWYGVDTGATAKPVTATKPSPHSTLPANAAIQSTTTTPTQAPTPAAPVPARQQASGGRPGLVWVNTSSKVYHCSGTAYYGKTKAGKYLSEADAKAEGDRPDHGKTCGQ